MVCALLPQKKKIKIKIWADLDCWNSHPLRLKTMFAAPPAYQRVAYATQSDRNVLIPWALILRTRRRLPLTRRYLTIRAWNARELAASAPAGWCFLPTGVHLTFSKSLLRPCPWGTSPYTHTSATFINTVYMWSDLISFIAKMTHSPEKCVINAPEAGCQLIKKKKKRRKKVWKS